METSNKTQGTSQQNQLCWPAYSSRYPLLDWVFLKVKFETRKLCRAYPMDRRAEILLYKELLKVVYTKDNKQFLHLKMS